MKYPILLLSLALASFAQAAELKFAEPVREVRPAADAETVAIDFNFANTSKKAVTISKADAGCTCMKVVFAGGKMEYAPGESGVMRAIFKLGQFSGTVERPISLWLDTDPKKPATQAVTAKIQIPAVIVMEPRTLKWASGGPAEPQTIRIRMADGKTIHVTDVKPSTEQFSTELKVVEEGRQYDLIVTPRDVTVTGVGVIVIETDSAVQKLQTQQVYAMVHQPMEATAK